MEITDLASNERLALVALLDAVIAADRSASEQEQSRLADVIASIGEDTYRSTLEYVDGKVETEDDLKALLQSVERREAQELIYATAMDLAISDVALGREVALLDWLAKTWGLQPEIEPVREDS